MDRKRHFSSISIRRHSWSIEVADYHRNLPSQSCGLAGRQSSFLRIWLNMSMNYIVSVIPTLNSPWWAAGILVVPMLQDWWWTGQLVVSGMHYPLSTCSLLLAATGGPWRGINENKQQKNKKHKCMTWIFGAFTASLRLSRWVKNKIVGYSIDKVDFKSIIFCLYSISFPKALLSF